MRQVLLIGCGSSRDQRVPVNGYRDFVDARVYTVDNNPEHNPDIVWDLASVPWVDVRGVTMDRNDEFRMRIDNDRFDEIHAYEVLEHLGQQGDYVSFFMLFSEAWRVLKPGGYFVATVPDWRSMWAWGDPSHTRIINEGTLVFLDQGEYVRQVGNTPMSDFRDVWYGDFETDDSYYTRDAAGRPGSFVFILRAIKPSRRQQL